MGNVPPSIIRSQMTAAKEERITEIVGGDPSRTYYYYRRCKRRRSADINSLPDEILFEVLIRLPVQDIYDNVRFVCRKWCHMIHTHDFVDAHFQHDATNGIIFSPLPLYKTTVSMATIKQRQVDISKFGRYKWQISSSCNGMILASDWLSDKHTLYITNLVTKRILVLPPLKRSMIHWSFQGIAYVAVSMEYKVVSTGRPLPRRSQTHKWSHQPCLILTVGVDKSWRHVGTEHLSFQDKLAFGAPPLITEGFMHWAICSNRVLTLNLETEIIVETSPPTPPHPPAGRVIVKRLIYREEDIYLY